MPAKAKVTILMTTFIMDFMTIFFLCCSRCELFLASLR
jgi:hypothetical protein